MLGGAAKDNKAASVATIRSPPILRIRSTRQKNALRESIADRRTLRKPGTRPGLKESGICPPLGLKRAVRRARLSG